MKEYDQAGVNQESKKSTHHHSILIAEDDEEIRKVLKFYLNSFGLQVDFALSGMEGIRLATTGQYDLILMDLNMPILSGEQSVVILRKLNVQIPIIALSAHHERSKKNECIEIGFDDYISKPFALDQLSNKIFLHLMGNENEKTLH